MALRGEPKTLNPITALDAASRDSIAPLHSDLIHIHRQTQQPEPALASSWTISPDGRLYTLTLREGVRFSDGHPLTADDVLFTFDVLLDAKTHSAQRDLLTVHGKPVVVRKTGTYTLQFELSRPYASALRLFDSIPILPRHKLLKAYRDGVITEAWNLSTPPEEIVGLGPFRVKRFVPGERVVLERNPFYWRKDATGKQLPYLEGLVFHNVPNDDIQAVRFMSGDFSILERPQAATFRQIKQRALSSGIRVYDIGPGLEYQFLLLNTNPVSPESPADTLRKQRWFRTPLFRRAISLAIDREAITRLVYHGLAAPIWTHVTPGNRFWWNSGVPRQPRSVDGAQNLLGSAGFTLRDGTLHDPEGNPVAFSILVTASNPQRVKIGTILQDDLRQVGMKVSVVSLDSRIMLDRVLNLRDYDAALMALDSTDVDPNAAINVLSVKGSLHLWNLSGTAQYEWEEEVDGLMTRQMTVVDPAARKRLYDRVQYLMAEHMPLIFLSSPHVLIAASDRLGNFQPSILKPNTLWNADSLFFTRPE